MPGRDAYMAVGYDRQLIVVMPKLDIVAVLTGSARFSTTNGTPARPRYGFAAIVHQLAIGSDGHRARGRTHALRTERRPRCLVG